MPKTKTKPTERKVAPPLDDSTISRAHLLQIYELLGNAKDIYKTVVARYTAIALRKRLEVHALPLIESRAAANDGAVIADFAAERDALCREYATKGEDGEPVIVDGNYDISAAKKPEFTAKFEKLRVKHKVAVDVYEAKIKEFNEFIVGAIKVPDMGLKLELTGFTDETPTSYVETLFPYIAE